MTIAVIEYDAGNTANVLRALDKLGVTAVLTAFGSGVVGYLLAVVLK